MAILQAMEPRQRLESIDWLRGFVMIIMALDHVRDFFSRSGQDPMSDPDIPLSLYLTRWVTHLCAPTFVLLAGLSVGLMAERKTKAELSRFLLSRGLWLIFLEMTVVTFAWKFQVSNSLAGIILGVIWAIGAGMILLAGLIHLPRYVVLTLGLAVLAGSGLFDHLFPVPANADLSAIWLSLHRQMMLEVGGIRIAVAYPLLAWCRLMACGYGLAPVFQWEPDRRRKFLYALGGGLLVLFLILRSFNVYGDPGPWQTGEHFLASARSFFNVSKYPPITPLPRGHPRANHSHPRSGGALPHPSARRHRHHRPRPALLLCGSSLSGTHSGHGCRYVSGPARRGLADRSLY